MANDPITRSTAEVEVLCRDLHKAISNMDKLIEEHRPTVFQEVYLTSEEVRSIFNLSLRSLQNYRDKRQIPYTMLGGKILYPQSAIYKLLEQHFIKALR